jgi:hypothetical protein
VNTKEQCIEILNTFTLKKNILCFLPKDDKNDMNIEVGNEILDLLVTFSENLFNDEDEAKYVNFRSKFKEFDCSNILHFLLDIYENISFKVRISIILGNFYKYIVVSNKGEVVINILINYLEEQTTKKPNEDKNDRLMGSVLNALVNISVGGYQNRKILLDGGITPLLFPVVNSSDTNVSKKAILLLNK